MRSKGIAHAVRYPKHLSRLIGSTLTAPLLEYLKSDPKVQEGKAMLFITVDSDGWPHAAMLSSWEIFATDERNIKVATYASSTTTGNLRRNGKTTIILVDSGMTYYVKGTAVLVKERLNANDYNSMFNIHVEMVLEDSIPGVEIIQGITFEGASAVERHGPIYDEISRAP